MRRAAARGGVLRSGKAIGSAHVAVTLRLGRVAAGRGLARAPASGRVPPRLGSTPDCRRAGTTPRSWSWRGRRRGSRRPVHLQPVQTDPCAGRPDEGSRKQSRPRVRCPSEPSSAAPRARCRDRLSPLAGTTGPPASGLAARAAPRTSSERRPVRHPRRQCRAPDGPPPR